MSNFKLEAFFLVNENDVKSIQGEAPGILSGGDDETETDETPDNPNFIGPILPRYLTLNGSLK